MAQEINFNALLKVLVDHTDSGNCKWDNLGDNQYRVILPSGSIVIGKIHESFNNSDGYTIDVYNLKNKIAGDIVYEYEQNNPMLDNLKSLCDKILDNENKEINRSIQELISDLENPWHGVK